MKEMVEVVEAITLLVSGRRQGLTVETDMVGSNPAYRGEACSLDSRIIERII
jgi:hypothetical protein